MTVLPRLAVDGTEPKLVFLPVADPAARRRIDILRRAHSSPLPAVCSFEDAIRSITREIVASW